MLPPGHLGVAVAIALRVGAPLRALPWLALGALSPDLIDKPIKYLGYTPYGRSIAHAPVTWLLLTLVTLLWVNRGRRPATAWVLVLWGAWSHLLADMSNDALAGWLFNGFVLDGWFGWPWLTPDDLTLRVSPLLLPCRDCLTPLELGVVGWALFILSQRWRKKKR